MVVEESTQSARVYSWAHQSADGAAVIILVVGCLCSKRQRSSLGAPRCTPAQGLTMAACDDDWVHVVSLGCHVHLTSGPTRSPRRSISSAQDFYREALAVPRRTRRTMSARFGSAGMRCREARRSSLPVALRYRDPVFSPHTNCGRKPEDGKHPFRDLPILMLVARGLGPEEFSG